MSVALTDQRLVIRSHGEDASREWWYLAHPSVPDVALAVVRRSKDIRGEVLVGIANGNHLYNCEPNAARLTGEALIAAAEFAESLKAPHPIEFSRAGKDIDGHEAKSADGPPPQPSLGATALSPSEADLDEKGGLGIAQASLTLPPVAEVTP